MINMTQFSHFLSERNNLWFPAVHQTLGIPRSEMPQVSSKDVPDFLKWCGFRNKKLTGFAPSSLKATQRDFNMEKVAGMMTDPEISTKPIMISGDGYVVDGHHRWLAAIAARKKMTVIRIEAPIKEILKQIEAYPKVFNKNIHEGIA